MCACAPCCVQLFGTPWTVARQAPLSMEFPRQEYLVPRGVKIIDPESRRRLVHRAWGGDGELVFKGDRASVWEEEDVLGEAGGDGCSYCVYYEGVCERRTDACVCACVCARPMDVCVCETHGCVCVRETRMDVCV